MILSTNKVCAVIAKKVIKVYGQSKRLTMTCISPLLTEIFVTKTQTDLDFGRKEVNFSCYVDDIFGTFFLKVKLIG